MPKITEEKIEYTPMLGKVFLGILRGEFKSLELYQKHYIGETIVFDNIEVTDKIELNLNERISSFTLNACKLADFSIVGVNIISIEINNTSIKNWEIRNSKITSISIINASKIYNILIVLDSKVQFLDVKNSTIDHIQGLWGSISSFQVSSKAKIGVCDFSNFESNFFTVVDDVAFGDITIYDESKFRNIEFQNRCKMGYLRIVNSKLSNIDCMGSDIGEVFLDNVNFENAFKLTNCKTPAITIGNLPNIEYFKITAGYIGVLKFTGRYPVKSFFETTCHIAKLDFESTILPKDNVIQFNDCFVNEILFKSAQNFGSISFKSIQALRAITEWERDLCKRNSEGDYLTMEAPKVPCITLLNSDLGKTSFIGCDLSTFDKFEYYNTKMLEVFVAGTKMPEAISVPEAHSGQELVQQKLAYNQFKKIYENIGDSVTALGYKAKELEVYRKMLNSNNGEGSWWELLNLNFNRITSFYGTDWWRGAKLFLSVGIIGFPIYCLLLGNLPGSDWRLFVEKAVHFIDFVNPLHKSDSLQEAVKVKGVSGFRIAIAYGVSELCRILIGLLLYQTIQAFRKHGKSGA